MRVDPLFHLELPSALNDMAGREATLSQQLSSGLRVARASDDPVAAAQSVRLGSQIAADDAYTSASSSVASRLQVTDTALGSVVSQITSAIALAVKASNGALNAANVQAIGQQIAGVRDEVITLANTSYAGQYLFSGTATGTQPYSLNTSTTPAAAVYAGDAASQIVRTPGGQKIVTGLRGPAIFSASGADALGSLNRLIADLATGTPASTTTADLEELRASLANVSTQRGTLGASLNSLQETSAYAATESPDFKAAQSSLVATDTTQVATDLSTLETQQKALLSVMASISRTNLFDFIQ